MCGEVIFRGEECVSLGWCFWHRACYGCLLYGSKLVVTAPTLADLFDDDNKNVATGSRESRDGDDVGFGLRAGREITEVPTCANCLLGCETDSTDQKTIVHNALRRVDRADGGLARKRWEKKDGQVSRRAVGKIERVPAVTVQPIQVRSSRYE